MSCAGVILMLLGAPLIIGYFLSGNQKKPIWLTLGIMMLCIGGIVTIIFASKQLQ